MQTAKVGYQVDEVPIRFDVRRRSVRQVSFWVLLSLLGAAVALPSKPARSQPAVPPRGSTAVPVVSLQCTQIKQVMEGDTGITRVCFRATLSRRATRRIRVGLRVFSGSGPGAATRGVDYLAPEGNQLSFRRGEVADEFCVKIRGDKVREANEVFYVQLVMRGNSSGFTINRDQDTVTVVIMNDDGDNINITPNAGAANNRVLLTTAITRRTVVVGGADLSQGRVVYSIETRGRLTVTDSSTIGASGILLTNGGGFVSSVPLTLNGGTLIGRQAVVAPVTNAGQVHPGAVITDSEILPRPAPGTLTVGPYTQQSSGKLYIEIGGAAANSEYDRLIVDGAATLAGSLNVSLTNSAYTPALGTHFWIARFKTFPSGTLTFQSPVFNGYKFATSYPYANGYFWLRLTVVRV